MSRLRVLAALAGAAAIAWLVWLTGPAAVAGQLAQLSWRLPVALLPYALAAVLDAAGWLSAFPARLPSLPMLVLARLAGEAVNVTTPTATLGGEPVKAWLVARTGVPLHEALVSVVVAKTALVVSHLAFLAVGLALALGRPSAAPALLATMVALLALGVVTIGAFVWGQQRGLFGASGRALGWLGVGTRITGHLDRLDADVRAFYRSRRGRLAMCGLFHFLGWLAGSAEVWVGLQLLGAPVDPVTAVVIEAFASAIRSATFLVPASLGVQEGGFVGIFVGFGLGAEVGLAFGLVRRVRELAWTAVGYAVLAAWRRPAGGAAAHEVSGRPPSASARRGASGP